METIERQFEPAEHPDYPICYSCRTYKPHRAKHCPFDQHCVDTYDHFCMWTGNTIGGNNHRLFYLTLSLETILLWIMTFGSIIAFIFYPKWLGVPDGTFLETFKNVADSMWWFYPVYLVMLLITCFVTITFAQQTKYILNNILMNEFINASRYSDVTILPNGQRHTKYNTNSKKRNFKLFITGERRIKYAKQNIEVVLDE